VQYRFSRTRFPSSSVKFNHAKLGRDLPESTIPFAVKARS
jgi:hypothetical protein